MQNLLKNRYMKRSHLSERKFREILKFFCTDIKATDTAELTCINRPTINTLFEHFRYCLVVLFQQETETIEDRMTTTHSRKGWIVPMP